MNSYYFVGTKILRKLCGKVGILICLILLFSVSQVTAQEIGRETLITVQSSSIPSFPAISGDTIVWTDARACFPEGYPGCFEIFLYNVQSGKEVPLTVEGDSTDHDAPSISGEYIAYQAFDATEFFTYDIQLYHSGEVTNLTDGTPYTNQIVPSVGGQWVVWKDYTNEICSIILFDIDEASNASYQPLVIDSNTESCSLEANSPPLLSGDRVVWEARRDGSYDIFLYNISEEKIYNITNNSPDSNQMYPEISENFIVWQDDREGNWDIFIANISNLSDIQVIPITRESDQVNPSIDSGIVVWEDKEVGSQLYLLDLTVSSTDAQMFSDGINNHYNPKISGNRVVYEKSIEGDVDIYMFTYGESAVCPVASFSSSTALSSTTAPFTVKFIDISEPAPDVRIWNFGDGTTAEGANPSHVYTSIGVYNVTLTVSTPACRNATTALNYVSIGRKPLVNFIGAPLCGRMPLTVSFTDRSSGNPTDWAWDFDMDSVVDSIEQNPTYEFTEGGSYSVNLTAVNSVGSDSLYRPGYISVMSQCGITVNTAIEGLIFGSDGSIQTVSINLTILGVSPDGDSVTFSPPDRSGIREITLFSDTSGFIINGDVMEGNITNVLLTSENIILDEFSEYPCSNCYFNFTLESFQYPVDATITPYSWEGTVPCDREDIQRTVSETRFDHVVSSAYEVQLVTSDLGTISNMTLFFAVNSSWVTDRSKVWVVRLGDDDVGQVLPTTYAFTDPDSNLDIFTARSPRGASTFLLSTLSKTGNPLQLVVLTAQQWLGGDGGGDDYGGRPIVTTTQTPLPTAVLPTTLPAPEPTSTPETLEQATIEAPIPTPTLPAIESPPSPVPTTTTPLPPFIPIIAWVAAAGGLWLIKRRK